jgi:tRNA threonylcarbamoyladenosine biosynthesis protein TsaE
MQEIRTFYSHSIKETESIANLISSKLTSNVCIYITGDMGSGKTCLSKFIAKNLNINDLNSATYSKVSISKGLLNLVHCDFHHINPTSTFIETEILPNLVTPWILIVEWPQVVYDIDCRQLIHIKLEYIGKFSRKISFSCFKQS